MAFTQTDLDAINAAVASGELTVKHNGREVTYRSVDDLRKARETILAELASTAPGARPGGSFRFRFTTLRGE